MRDEWHAVASCIVNVSCVLFARVQATLAAGPIGSICEEDFLPP